MIQCKRFRWEDEFNEWAKKENIQSHHVMTIKYCPPDSMMIFYDKGRKDNGWITTTASYSNDSITVDGNRINMTR